MNDAVTNGGSDGDTIVALSSAPGLGAVALIRVSGPAAWSVGSRLAARPEKYERLEARKSGVLSLLDPRTGEGLDRAVIVKYKAPESFTGEDTLEVQCHGGIAVPLALVEALKAAGARQARSGEFTRRAFLNGKLDLAQAEAVDDLVHARGEAGRRVALAGLSGELGAEVKRLRDRLTELRAELEYDIDFPEEEPLANPAARLKTRLEETVDSIRRLLAGAERNVRLTRGALVVIAGAPNAGKSSLFNALAGEERSIVTPTAGTTRDAVEVECLIGGVLFRLVDTAGLRTGRSDVEKAGVEYSRRYLERADIVVFLHEANKRLNPAENEFLSARGPAWVVRVLSKADLLADNASVPNRFLAVSVKSGDGLEALRGELLSLVLPRGGDATIDLSGPQVTRLRQRELLAEALEILEKVDLSRPAEFVAADIQEASERLDEITGRVTGEEILERIFSRFCIGK